MGFHGGHREVETGGEESPRRRYGEHEGVGAGGYGGEGVVCESGGCGGWGCGGGRGVEGEEAAEGG